MTLSDFFALPDWEKDQLMQWERERFRKMVDLQQSLIEKKKLTVAEHVAITIAMWG